MTKAQAQGRSRDLIHVASSRFKLLIVCFLIGSLSGFGAALILERTYSASVLLAPVPPETDTPSGIAGIGGLASIASVLGGASSSEYFNRYLATLRSRQFCETFLHSAGISERLRGDLESRWQLGRLLGRADSPTKSDLCDFFNEHVRRVAVDSRTSFVTITVRHPDRILTAAWANGLTAAINAALRDEAIRNAEESIRYLTAEMRKTDVLEVREAITRAMSSRVRAKALAATRADFAFSIIDPAVVPDPDDFDSPRPALMAVAGGLIASFAALLVLLLRFDRQSAH